MNDNFILKMKKGIRFFTFKTFTNTGLVNHCITTRYDGSGDILNMKENICKNHKIIADSLNFNFENMVVSDQIHEKHIFRVNRNDCGKGITKKSDINGVDGLITNEKNIPLVTYYADCVPLLFVDPISKSIANVHAGWKGTTLKIGQETIDRLNQEYGSKAENILVGIGPSIGKCCYEIDEPVISKVKTAFPNYWSKLLIKNDCGKYHLDLWEANFLQLVEKGVRKENISLSGICTSCNNEISFSHRKEKGRTGRFAAIIQLL